LAILLQGLDLEQDADWLGIGGEIADNIATDISQSLEKQKRKKPRSKKKQVPTVLARELAFFPEVKV